MNRTISNLVAVGGALYVGVRFSYTLASDRARQVANRVGGWLLLS